MAYAAGVDVGSTQTKAVIIDEDRHIVSRALIDTGANVTLAAENAYAAALQNGRIQEEEVQYVVGTGYGRYKVTFGDTQITEISCHGRGAVHMFPSTRTVVDMGGQDTKAIRVNAMGEIVDFCMNDKCAAGTGRFLGAVASALDVPLSDLGPLTLTATRAVKISTTCTVFAESEVINHLSMGVPPSDIMYSAIVSLVSRSVQLMRRVRMETVSGKVNFSGSLTRDGALNAESHSGAVDLLLPADLSAEFDLTTYQGSISNGFVPERRPTSQGAGQELHITVDTGTANITVRTFKGPIILRKKS